MVYMMQTLNKKVLRYSVKHFQENNKIMKPCLIYLQTVCRPKDVCKSKIKTKTKSKNKSKSKDNSKSNRKFIIFNVSLGQTMYTNL